MSLSFVSLYSKAATCPPVDSINRIPGEYLWQTTVPGWNGYFIAPTTGRGHSYTVQKFIQASWVKAHDAADSAGFIQCDYIGNFGFNASSNSDDAKTYEIIRFTQNDSNSAYAPSTELSWSCEAIVQFPSEACNCYGNLDGCGFRLG